MVSRMLLSALYTFAGKQKKGTGDSEWFKMRAGICARVGGGEKAKSCFASRRMILSIRVCICAYVQERLNAPAYALVSAHARSLVCVRESTRAAYIVVV